VADASPAGGYPAEASAGGTTPSHPPLPVGSAPGRNDPVELYTAEPVLGKSALIMPLVQADGIVVIPEGVEGVEAGEPVIVHLL
jgi:MoeA C-terminal region (domain IV)